MRPRRRLGLWARSVVTFSTVGYGDIRPYDDGIRVLASIQVITGQLLLLFGFAEIMRARKSGAEVKDPRGHGPAG
ncbi:MAG TPA: potassium channel family protein [Acetobacteraceae bacterium]|nr:potassium channel family protein [Acetobacteraceae bacterium]